MSLIIFLSLLMFVFYYLACFNTLKFDHQWVFIAFFLIVAIIVRFLIDPNLNKDYYGYFALRNFDDPKSFTSFLLSEPYIYFVFKFFSFFTSDREIIFKGIYWFNFIITNLFFIWLATRKDILIWKKILLFSFYYFLFGFVLLRNAPVYILYAYFFYYTFRNQTYRKILLTPFMHLSALPLLVIMFQKNKHYLKFLLLACLIILPLIIFYFIPNLTYLISKEDTISKINTYTKAVKNVAIFHKIHIVFVSFVILSSIWVYKKRAFNPIFITTFLLYFLAFYINPVLGFRFSPYVFFAVFLFHSKIDFDTKIEKNLSLGSFLFFPYFLSTLFSTHTFKF